MTLSFWLILLAVLAYGLLHSLLASLQAKATTRSWLGRRTDQWYRLAYNLVAILTLLPILVLPVLLIDKELYRIPSPWLYLTLLIQLIAVFVAVVGLKQTGITSFLGLRQLLLPENVSPPRLVSTGLYHYVRHPVYTAGLVFIWLIPLMTCNLLALNIGLTVYILVGAHFEERKLSLELGKPYVEYRRRTPMLIPGLKPHYQKDVNPDS